jgi:hypothetical protein
MNEMCGTSKACRSGRIRSAFVSIQTIIMVAR